MWIKKQQFLRDSLNIFDPVKKFDLVIILCHFTSFYEFYYKNKIISY